MTAIGADKHIGEKFLAVASAVTRKSMLPGRHVGAFSEKGLTLSIWGNLSDFCAVTFSEKPRGF